MATENNRPFVMTCDAVDAAVEDETVHITVPFKVEKQDDEPRGDDTGEGEPTSQVTTDAAPTPPGVKYEGKLIHIVRRIRVVPEKVEDEAKDALAKDEAIAMDKRPVALSAADCTAKNPLRCPYHGAAAMSEKFAEILKKHGLGDMKFSIKPFDDEDAEDKSYVLDFECPEEYAETNGMEALKEFGKLKGIVIDTEDTEGLIEKTEEDRREALFEVDFFDKDAEDPKTDAGEEATEEAKEEATPEATEKPVEAPKAEEAPKATEDTPKAPETASEPPKTEEEHKKDPKDDFEEDTKAPEKAPEDDFEEDTKKPEHEPAKPSKDIPKDPVERALKAIEDFDGMVSGARIHKIEEAKGNCDSCAKDIDFLKKAIDGAPNDRVKKMLESKLEAAAKEMDIYQSELKHACGDAMRELKDAIASDKLGGRYECETKMEYGSGSEIRKEIDDLRVEAEIPTLTKVDGYKEMRKAEKTFDEAKAEFQNLCDDYDNASAADDYRLMMDLGDKIKKQMEKCNSASDSLKLARENVKASLVKKVDAARKARYAITPERLKQRGLIPGETIEQYTERLKKLGMKLPVSFDCREYVKSEEFAAYCKKMGISTSEMESARRTTNTYAKAIKKADEHYRDSVFHMDDESYKKMCAEFADIVNENMERCAYGCRIYATDRYGSGGHPLDAVICGHLMNQMESGTSHGSGFSHKGRDNAVATNTRAKYSHTCYGGAYHMPPDKYEKYGCIASASPIDDFGSGDPSGSASHYGDCIIRFRKDKVAATVSSGDSSWGWGKSISSLPLITDCKPTLASNYEAESIVKRVKRGMSPREFQRALGGGGYCELHYHEENMGAEFIESISLPNKSALSTLSPEAIKLILKHGIKVYIGGKPHTVTA